jgi:LPS export ABC transporter protein LptC
MAGQKMPGLICLAISLLFLAAGCKEEPPTVRLGSSNRVEEPTILFEGFQMVSTNSGTVEWKFFARAAQIYEKSNTAKAQDIKIIYWRGGHPSSTLTARRGFVKTDTNDIRAEENVVMVSQEGVVLRTERLLWNHQLGRLSTDLPVTVERQGSVLTGVGLTADSELKHVEILSHVKINVPSVKSFKATPTVLPEGQP